MPQTDLVLCLMFSVCFDVQKDFSIYTNVRLCMHCVVCQRVWRSRAWEVFLLVIFYSYNVIYSVLKSNKRALIGIRVSILTYKKKERAPTRLREKKKGGGGRIRRDAR